MQMHWPDVGIPTTALLVLLGLLLMGGAGAVQAQPNPPGDDPPPPGPGGIGAADGTSDLELWLDAGDLSLSDGQSVSSWSDLSGNDKNVSQSTGDKQPTFRTSGFNGRPVLEFDGDADGDDTDDDFLKSSGELDFTSGYTIFVVAKNDQTKAYNGLFRIAPDVSKEKSYLELYWQNASSGSGNLLTLGNRSVSDTTRGYASVDEAGPAPGNKYLVTASISDGDADATRFINGADEGQDQFSSGSQVPYAADTFYVGTGTGFDDGVNSEIDGQMAEVIAYRDEISQVRRTIVNSYLANKYGLSTGNAEVEPYAHSSTHFEDFAGLGQAGDGTNETDALSGALRLKDPTALDNGDFLFYGHDGANASSWSTTDAPSTVGERLDREWRLDEIDGGGGDGVGTLTVEVDADDLPSTPSGARYYVLVDGDGDFSNTGDQTRTRLTLDTDETYNASGVDVADGDYVTLAQGGVAATPQKLTAESDLNQEVALDWDAVTTDETGSPTTLTGDEYRIYQNTSPDFSGASKVATASSTSKTISGLTNNTPYYFWVTAVNNVGESDEQDPPADATPALKVSFASARSSADEGASQPRADAFTVTLSDTHGNPVDVTLSASGTPVLQSVETVTIQNAGSGYSVGDVIGEDDPGDSGSGMEIEVSQIKNGDEIDKVNLRKGGTGYTSAPTSFTTRSGGGSGADFSATIQPSVDDYTVKENTLTIPAGETTITVNNKDTLSIGNDSAPEATETVNLDLNSPTTTGTTPTVGSQSTHKIDIQDDDIPRKAYLVDNLDTNDDGKSKANENTTVTYTLETSDVDNVNNTDIRWEIDTSAAATEATAADFTTLSGTATITSGNTTTTFDLPITDDNTFESDEDVVVRLVSATNAGLKDDSGCSENTDGCYTSMTHTIQNDDSTPSVSFVSGASTIPDEDSDPSIDVQINPTASQDTDVDLVVDGGTATSGGTDYSLNTSTVTIPSGQSSVTLDGTDLSISQDVLDENNETVDLKLQNATGNATVDGANNTHQLTITDDDPTPTVAFDATASQKLEPGGSTAISLSLSQVSGRDVTVNYSKGGTATAGPDYSDDDGGSVTISAGNTSEDINLTLKDDSEIEPDETVTLSFGSSDLTNANTGGTTSHTFTITDDDIGSTGPAGVGRAESNKLWLRADEGVTTSGSNVTDWSDQSGNGKDVTASAGFEKPELKTNALNGQPVLNFKGDADGNESNDAVLEAAGTETLNLTSGYTIFMVARNNKSQSYNGLFRIAPDVSKEKSYLELYWQSGDNSGNFLTLANRAVSGVSRGFGSEDGAPPSADTEYLATASISTGDDDADRFIDGDLQPRGPGDSFQSGKHLPDQADQFYVGIGFGDTVDGILNGIIAETIVFDRDLNGTRRTLIHNYLSAKYGIDLTTSGSATDVYAGDNGGNGNYDRGVFGVGRQSSTDLHIGAETDGLRLDVASGLANGDYLVAGHRAAANVANASDVSGVSGTLERRFQRAWYVDRSTDSAPAITADVTFDLSEAGLDGSAGAKGNYVLIKRDANATAGTSWNPVQNGADAVTGDEITFNGIAFPDGKEVTLATTDAVNSPIDANSLAVEGTAGIDGSDQGWRVLGLPVTGGTAGDLQRADGSQFIDFRVNMAYTNPGGSVEQGSGDTGWTVVDDATTALTNGRGFIVWLFDNASYPLDPSITLQTASGLTGPGATNVTVGSGSADDPTLSQSDKQFLLANPYAVPFDLGSLNGTGFDDPVQVWKPNASSPSGQDDGNAGSWVTRSRGSSSDEVASWQGFLLTRSSTGSGDTQVTFNESGRAPTSTPDLVGSKATTGTPTQHRVPLRLVGRDADGTLTALDRAISVLFHEDATDGRDRYDAPKFEPMTESYATLAPVAANSDTTLRAQESRPLPRRSVERVPLSLQQEGVGGTFEVAMPSGGEVSTETPSIPDGWTVKLTDTKNTADPSDDETHVLTPGGTPYTFEAASDKTASKAQADTSNTEAQASDGTTAEAGQADAPRPTLRRLSRSGAERPAAKAGTAKDGGASSPRFTLAVEPAEALPVELAELNARRDGERAVLSWQTAAETNNAGFQVQHQRLPAGDTSATPTAADWSTLGFVEGAGTTTEAQSYRHETAALDYGRHVFRLKQVDTDGAETATEPVEVQMRLAEAYAVEAPYPNPSRREATLPVTVRESQEVTVSLYDVLGRRVRVVRDRELPGQDTRRIALPVQQLASGTYFVRVRGDGFTATRRLTVVR